MRAPSAPAAAAAAHPDLIEQMTALNRTVERLEKAATLEKLELAPMAIAQTRALLDSLVCAVLAQAKALRENNERKNTDGR